MKRNAHQWYQMIFLALILITSYGSPAWALKFNIIYENSVTSNPNSSQIQGAINKAAAILEGIYTNPITVNVQIGFGSVAGATTNCLGCSGAMWSGYYPLSTIQSLLLSTPKSADDNLAYAHLPPASMYSSGSGVWLTTAQQKAFGMVPANSSNIDGYVAFGAGYAWTFDDTNGVAAGTYGLTSVALHELSEVLGRISGLPSLNPGIYDLFRYENGMPKFSPGTAYFSIDGGATVLANFSATADPGDWATDAISQFSSCRAYAAAGEKYTFQEVDKKTLDVSGFSMQPLTILPSIPSGLKATAGNAQVALAWLAANNATAYDVYRSAGGSPMIIIASGITNTNYTDFAVLNGTTYTYGVVGLNSYGVGSMSSLVSATPQAPITIVPSEPTNLSVKVTTSGPKKRLVYKVALSWAQASNQNITKNKIYRSGWSSPVTINAATNYIDSNVVKGVKYTYWVTAVNSVGESMISNQVNVTP